MSQDIHRERIVPHAATYRRELPVSIERLYENAIDWELRRWITSTLDGPGAGSEIWTHAHVLGGRQTLVVVDFFVPGLEMDQRQEVGRYYSELYARLYDEDIRMMAERQSQL